MVLFADIYIDASVMVAGAYEPASFMGRKWPCRVSKLDKDVRYRKISIAQRVQCKDAVQRDPPNNLQVSASSLIDIFRPEIIRRTVPVSPITNPPRVLR